MSIGVPFFFSRGSNRRLQNNVDGRVWADQHSFLLAGRVALLRQQLPALGRRRHVDPTHSTGLVSS